MKTNLRYERVKASETGYMLGVIVGGMSSMLGVDTARDVVRGLADDETFWNAMKAASPFVDDISKKVADKLSKKPRTKSSKKATKKVARSRKAG